MFNLLSGNWRTRKFSFCQFCCKWERYKVKFSVSIFRTRFIDLLNFCEIFTFIFFVGRWIENQSIYDSYHWQKIDFSLNFVRKGLNAKVSSEWKEVFAISRAKSYLKYQYIIREHIKSILVTSISKSSTFPKTNVKPFLFSSISHQHTSQETKQ